MADRKSVSAEDTIRSSIESRSSRVVCGVRCRPCKTSLCAALKRVKIPDGVLYLEHSARPARTFSLLWVLHACMVYSWTFCLAVVTCCDSVTEQLLMTINNGVLAYIKAFRQRADTDSVRNHVLGKYSSSLIRSAKDVLWEGCSEDLGRLKLEKKTRRSSSTRPQELADLDDILEAFNVLDDDNCLPEIVCSAEDLLQMPQLLPLHGIEQVAEEVRSFREVVCSRLDNIDRQLKQFDGAAAPQPSSPPSSGVSSAGIAQMNPPDPLERRCNLILFGVGEEEDLTVVPKVLEAVSGNMVPIKDMFRLGRKTKQVQSTSTPQPSGSSAAVRPRPILIKLNCPWDRRIILAGKKKLSSVEGMEKYFLQPDLSVDERKRRRDAYLARKGGSARSDNND